MPLRDADKAARTPAQDQHNLIFQQLKAVQELQVSYIFRADKKTTHLEALINEKYDEVI